MSAISSATIAAGLVSEEGKSVANAIQKQSSEVCQKALLEGSDMALSEAGLVVFTLRLCPVSVVSLPMAVAGYDVQRKCQ